MEWFEIKHKLPSEGMSVLTYDDSYFRVGEILYEENGIQYFFDGDCVYECTHWMPLPDAPKNEV